MLRYLIAAALVAFSLVSDASAQKALVSQSVVAGELIVLVPDVGSESRTVWNLNYPESFEEYAEENGKLFISMPDRLVSFSLLVIPKDTTQPIRNLRYVLKPTSGPGKPDPVTPHPKPPVANREIFDQVLALAKRLKPGSKPYATKVAVNFQRVASRLHQYKTVREFSIAINDLNYATLGNHETLGDKIYKDWVAVFFDGVKPILDDVRTKHKITDVGDYAKYLTEIADALSEDL